MRRAALLALALGLDLVAGEPAARMHPVVWFGRLVSALERRLPRGAAGVELTAGTTLVVLSLGVVLAASFSAGRLLAALGQRGPLLAFFAEAWLLKTTLAVRALVEAARAVQRELERGDLDGARTALQSLVSRDTKSLTAPLVAAAAVESVAENASDGIVAPALAYLAAGLPGAAVYRGLNTLDAMIGYRGAFEWIGKTAARLDDAANWIPARFTAGLLVAAAAVSRRSGRAAWRILWRDHGRTTSPNAGWPMSAMAGALGVELEKIGHYRLGAPGRAPGAGDVDAATRLVHLAVGLGLGLVAAVEVARLASRRRPAEEAS